MNTRLALLASSLVPLLLSCANNVTPAAQFALQPTETTLEVTPGGEVSSFVLLNRQAGFADTVRMRFDDADLPAGLTQQWSRDSANGDCTLRLLASADVKPGTYKLKLTGTPVQDPPFTSTPLEPASLITALDVPTALANITVTVVPALPDFSVSAQPSFFTSLHGGGTFLQESAIRVTGQNGIVGSVSLSVSNLPQGVTVSFSRNSVIPSSVFDHSVLRLFVEGSAVPGLYTFSLNATSGSKTKTVQMGIRITDDAVKPGFTRLLPDTVSITRPASGGTTPAPGLGIVQIITEQFHNADAPIVFEGLPAGVSVVEINTPFRPLPEPIPSKATWRYFKLTVGATSPAGNFPVIVKSVLTATVAQAKILSLEIKAP